MSDLRAFISLVQDLYGRGEVDLHAPVFCGHEKRYVNDCIDSTFVSSVGEYVSRFELGLAEYCNAKRAVAMVNGTSALQVALMLAGVKPGDEVITQPLTFVATCNAISHCGAVPTFVDVDTETLGMSAESLAEFFETFADGAGADCVNKATGRKISAVMPMHTFGNPCDVEQIRDVCEKFAVPLVEDAAESLGSWRNGQHTGLTGVVGAISFNGNKIITTGGGGALITNDDHLADMAKHVTTTAKVPHIYEYVHDQVAFNYRMPNLNAALGLAQLEQLGAILKKKKKISDEYQDFFARTEFSFLEEPDGVSRNNWLNAIFCDSRLQRDDFLQQTNRAGIRCRPAWNLMTSLPMYRACHGGQLQVAMSMADRLVNIPSGVPL